MTLKTMTILMVIYGVCAVAFFGTCVWVAVHFISKFW